MLDFIRGSLVKRSPTELVLDVGGLGLRISVPVSTSSALAQKQAGEVLELKAHLQINSTDPSVKLFGFASENERRMFELLTAVKGVGPGTAIRILSGATVEELRDAILMQDIPRLVRVKGIGKKTAERILFDLKEKIAVLGDMIGGEAMDDRSSTVGEALIAMTALGYDAKESRKAVDRAVKKLGESASSEEYVRQALQEIR